MMKKLLVYRLFLLLFLVHATTVAAEQITFASSAQSVLVCSALPSEARGVDIAGHAPTFHSRKVEVKDGLVTIDVTPEPVWIIENTLPSVKALTPQKSPFGMLPANADLDGSDYRYAKEIGVDWQRGGLRTPMWFTIQPDPANALYNWDALDRHVANLPPGMQQLQNIMVGRMPDRPAESRSPRGARNNHSIADPLTETLSRYLQGSSYRPKDPQVFEGWVRAMVERYDGDGIDDMPGLTTPVSYWQIANEPTNAPGGYEYLVELASTAIKEAAPEAKVVLGGIFLPYPAARRYENSQLSLLENLHGNYVDIIDLHWFGEVGEWQHLPGALARVRSDLGKFNFRDVPIWMTEVGTYSGQPTAKRRARYASPYQSERAQADEMVKRYVIALGEGVEKIFWAWGMVEGYSDPNDNDFFDNTGLVYDGIGPQDPGKGVKKISYWSYEQMTRFLGYWDGMIPDKIESSSDLFAYRFRYKNSDIGIVSVWSTR